MQAPVFITSVHNEEDQRLIVSTLTRMEGIKKTNFDKVNGRDILRVEVKEISPFVIEGLLISQGFICVQVH